MDESTALQVGDVIKDKGTVVTLEQSGTLYDARNLMIRYNISRVVILWENRYAIGILTEKDIVRFLYRDTYQRRLDEIKVNEAMSRPPVTGHKNESLISCAKKMIDRKISSVLIVEANIHNDWEIVGMITKTDIIKAYPMLSRHEYKVSDFMTRNVYTVAPDSQLHEAMLIMVDSNISRVVVVDKTRPVGVITMHDLLPVGTLVNPFFSKFETDDFELASPRQIPSVPLPSGVRSKLIASDIMKTDLSTITKDRGLGEAAEVMVEKRISGLPVVENGSILVGLISKTDITRASIFGEVKSGTEA